MYKLFYTIKEEILLQAISTSQLGGGWKQLTNMKHVKDSKAFFISSSEYLHKCLYVYHKKISSKL
jgi:hypothetical protein